MSSPPIAGHNELLERTARALQDESLTPVELDRLLARAERRGRYDSGGLYRALGLLTIFSGVVFLYLINYHGLTHEERKLTPFLFPLALLAFSIALDRFDRPAWEVEFSLMVADIALALTFLADAGAWSAGRSYGVAAGVISLVISVVMYAALRRVRLTTWAVAASIVAMTTFSLGHGSAHHVARVFMLEAVAAAVVGYAALRQSRPVGAQSLYLAALLALFGGLVGVVADASWANTPGVSIWAAVLFATTLAALATAAIAELTGLVWLGALGAILTLAAVVEPSRRDSQWAYLMMVIGVLLAGAGAVMHRGRRLSTLGGQGS